MKAKKQIIQDENSKNHILAMKCKKNAKAM